jgi:hypothetical protein
MLGRQPAQSSLLRTPLETRRKASLSALPALVSALALLYNTFHKDVIESYNLAYTSTSLKNVVEV